MTLTRIQLDALVNELRKPIYIGLTIQRAFDLLNNPQQETITETVIVPPRLSIMSLFGALSTASKAKVANYTNLGLILSDVKNNDVTAVGNWAQALLIGGIITTDDVQSLNVMLQPTTEQRTRIVIHEPRILQAFVGISGMPNIIDPADFNIAWQEVTNG